jgi:uncharacterized phiE125 gp8 family phage protein
VFPPFGGIGPYGQYGNLGLYGALSAFGSLALTESSPPQSFSEILTLAEVKSYLRLPDRSPADQAEDDELTSLIVAAREQAEILQGRDLIRKQFDLSLDYWNNYRIELRDPLASVDLFQYKDSTGTVTAMAEGSDFIVDTSRHPGFVSPPYNKTWPTFATWPSSAILIRFTSGYAATSPFWRDAGARVKNGMKLLINNWYHNRLPFEKGVNATAEYPYAVTACLSYGSLVRAR